MAERGTRETEKRQFAADLLAALKRCDDVGVIRDDDGFGGTVLDGTFNLTRIADELIGQGYRPTPSATKEEA